MAALWMLAAELLFAAMGVCVKLGAARFSSSELVFYRSFVSLLIVSALLLQHGTPLPTTAT